MKKPPSLLPAGSLALFRIVRDWTVNDFAAALGMSRAQVINLEQGHFATRRFHVLALIGLANLVNPSPLDRTTRAAIPDINFLREVVATLSPEPKQDGEDYIERRRFDEWTRHTAALKKKNGDKKRGGSITVFPKPLSRYAPIIAIGGGGVKGPDSSPRSKNKTATDRQESRKKTKARPRKRTAIKRVKGRRDRGPL